MFRYHSLIVVLIIKVITPLTHLQLMYNIQDDQDQAHKSYSSPFAFAK